MKSKEDLEDEALLSEEPWGRAVLAISDAAKLLRTAGEELPRDGVLGFAEASFMCERMASQCLPLLAHIQKAYVQQCNTPDLVDQP